MKRSTFFTLSVAALLVILLVVDAKPVPKSSSKKSWAFANWNGASSTWKKTWGVVHDSYGQANRAFVKDPAGGTDTVLRITYPAGTYAPHGSVVGGTGFYAQPIKLPTSAVAVTFEYQIYFQPKFNFMKGGKMPGLFGGHSSCSGGNPATDCFSTRLMWRTAGAGELYAYIPKDPQVSSLCSTPGDICNPDYGDSLGRGKIHFKAGEWITIRQTITPNAKAKTPTGKATIWLNGKKSIEFNDLDMRLVTTVNTMGIDFETFFGGADSTWATPTTQHTYFKGFKLSYA